MPISMVLIEPTKVLSAQLLNHVNLSEILDISYVSMLISIKVFHVSFVRAMQTPRFSFKHFVVVVVAVIMR